MPQFNNRDEWEARLKRTLTELTAPQADKLIKLLGDPPNIDRVPESFWRDLGDNMAEALQPALEKIYVESAQQTNSYMPRVLQVDWHLANQPAASWAERYTFDLVTGIDTTTRDRLQHYVSSFFTNEGSTVGDLREMIGNLFGESRADLIATTEVTRAAAQGDIGMVNEIQKANPNVILVPFWDTSMDEWVCPICGKSGLQGVQGVMVGGQPQYTSRNGQTYGPPPSAHPRCRCGQRWEPQGLRKGATSPKPAPAPKPTTQPPATPPVTPPPPAAPAPVATPRAGQPKGKAVSTALKIPKSKFGKIYQKVLDLIDSVHGDGTLKPIPIKTQKLEKGYLGMFRATRDDNQPFDILVSPEGQHYETTLAHELGHYLDNHLGNEGKVQFASETAAVGKESPLTAWWEAVQSTKAYQQLVEVQNHPEAYTREVTSTLPNGGTTTFRIPVNPEYLEYVLRPREIWARSYAQYITLRGGDPTMLEQMADEQKDKIYTTQWSDDDFEAVANAMDATMLAIGWTE